MFNHLDQVRIKPPTHVWKQLEGAEYHELWDESKFLEPVELLGDPVSVFSSGTNLDENDRLGAVVVRKLVDSRYLVTIVVTCAGSGYFSDANYQILNEDEMVLADV